MAYGKRWKGLGILLVLFFLSMGALSQPSLNFFTNRADLLLQAQFGFGVTNIPVYASNNVVVAYSAAIHYVLQSAANAWEQTTPDTNFPSVFRPLFLAQSNSLMIVGYTNVTTDFDAQMSLGFKDVSDPTIGLNDNVWGIPWVIGAKGHAPAFNEYSYTTACSLTRRLQVTRAAVNLPPNYTNAFHFMTFSNVFAAEAWNFNTANFSNPVTILVSNQISMTLTNNYNWGTNFIICNTTNWTVNSWPGSVNGNATNSFKIPLLVNSLPLPVSFWSESGRQFIPANGSYPASDLHQTGWPEYDWTLSISNKLMYVLLDTSTGTNRVLDFVNLNGLESLLDINGQLDDPFIASDEIGLLWSREGATPAANSPMSVGMGNQIQISLGNVQIPSWSSATASQNAIAIFRSFVLERGWVGLTITAPYEPSVFVFANNVWEAGNPMVHYTTGDLSHTINPVVLLSPSFIVLFPLPLGSITELNSVYTSAKTSVTQTILPGGAAQLNFSGYTNLPYGVWGSTNLSDWTPLGTSSQTSPGVFQFTDLDSTNFPNRFYQLRVP